MATKEQIDGFMAIRDAAEAAGIMHPDVIAAQWALETGWGKSESGKYNYWGVKAGNGEPTNSSPGTVRWTTEVVNGKTVRVQQKFKDYNSLNEAMQDRKAFTNKTGGRYDKAGYFEAKTPSEAAKALEKGGYATDKNYAKKLTDVMKSAGVDPDKKYDNKPERGKGGGGGGGGNSGSGSPLPNSHGSESRGNIKLMTPEGEKEFYCPSDVYILDEAEDMGIDLPYSCRTGSCSSCVGQLVSGRVDQSDQSFLDDEQVTAGWVCLCVAYPLEDCVIKTHQEEKLTA